MNPPNYPPTYRKQASVLLSETAVIFIGRGVAVIAQLLGIKVLTTLLPVDTYGQLSLILSASLAANLLFYGPFGQGAARFLPIALEAGVFTNYERSVREIAKKGTKVILLIGSAIAAASVALEAPYSWVVIVGVTFLACADGFNSSLAVGLLNAHRKRGLAVLVDLLDKTKYAVAALAIYYWGGGYGVVIGGFIVTAASLMMLNGYLYRQTFSAYRTGLERPPETHYDRSIIAYFSPFVVWGVFTWAQAFLERYSLERYYTSADVAAYSVINQFGFQTISLAGGLLMQVISPILFQESVRTTSYAKLRRAGLCFTALMTILLLLTSLYTREILVLLTDEKYGAYAQCLPWMMLSGICFAGGQLLSTRLLIDLEPKRLLWPKIGAALLEISLLGLLVPTYGIGGVVASSLVANLGYSVGVWLVVQTKTERYEVAG